MKCENTNAWTASGPVVQYPTPKPLHKDVTCSALWRWVPAHWVYTYLFQWQNYQQLLLLKIWFLIFLSIATSRHCFNLWKSKSSCSSWRKDETKCTRETCISFLGGGGGGGGFILAQWSHIPSTILRALAILMNFCKAPPAYFRAPGSRAIFLHEFLCRLTKPRH